MKKILILLILILMPALMFAQDNKRVVRRTIGGGSEPLRLQYYDSQTAEWYSRSEWKQLYGKKDLRRADIVPFRKGFDVSHRYVSMDWGPIIGGTVLLSGAVSAWIMGYFLIMDKADSFKYKFERNGNPLDLEKYEMYHRRAQLVTSICCTAAGLSVIVWLCGIKVEYYGLPVGHNSYIDTAGAGVKYTMKF